MKPHFILILLVFPAACVPNTQTKSEQVARQDGAVPSLIIAADTPPAGDLLAPAYPPPPALPTSPYPGPAGSGWQPSPTPTIGIQHLDDCELHPIFSRCGGIQLNGKVAYIQPNGRLTVLDLDTERAWSSSQAGVKDVAWSPAGNLLLVRDERLHTFLYQADGNLFDNHDDGLTWQRRGHTLQSGSLIWSDDTLMAASLIFVELVTSDHSRGQVERRVQIDFHDGSGQNHWLLEDPGFRYDTIGLFDWAPEMEWLLFGRSHGGVASQQVTGYRLLALNARSGEVADSGLSIPADAHFDWHPSEPGLLVTTNLSGSDVMTLGTLAVWRLLENQVTYPLTRGDLARSPIWSPDGRSIAYTGYELSGTGALMLLDTVTGVTRAVAELAEAPAWSRNGSTLFYLELMPGNQWAKIRAVEQNGGESWTVAVSRLPGCPGPCNPRTAFDYAP
jgi:hypothetical protein